VLLVVSTGSVEDNREQGLRSTLVIEPADRGVGKSFGAEGTPSAVLVDEEGQIASQLAVGAPAVLDLTRPDPNSAGERIELTIGMAAYDDFDGVYFTLQALRLYQDLAHAELLVIDNYGCDDTKNLVERWVGARYVRATDATGTAAPRDLVFREARGEAVLCCDCHVLFAPGAIARLKRFYRDHPDCLDLLQGPVVFDDARLLATHFSPEWRDQMWGTWECDARGVDPEGEPFEIPMQGLGVFSCRRSAWLGFHPGFRGFGGEEGYIHEKFRQAGRHCLCLPWLRWMHRFSRPGSVKYPVVVEDKLRNYVLGHTELGLDLSPVLEHFAGYLPADRIRVIADQAVAEERVRFPRYSIVSPRVSVVMPVHNGERYVRPAVQSLLRQTLQHIEIIVVDDGSTDRTAEILNELAAVDPRLRIIYQHHGGEPQARNRGIAEARAAYVAAHDADDISLPGRLARQYAFLEQNPDVGVVGSFAHAIDDTGTVTDLIGGPVTYADIELWLPRTNCLVHGSVMMRRSALEAVGTYRGAFVSACDYDLWLRMAEHVEVANISEALYLYRWHDASGSKSMTELQVTFARIAQELALERRRSGSDLLMRGGDAAFMHVYGTQLLAAGLAEALPRERASTLQS
jgi:glycosyltransferase involved in cell wall biosynthesis